MCADQLLFSRCDDELMKCKVTTANVESSQTRPEKGSRDALYG